MQTLGPRSGSATIPSPTSGRQTCSVRIQERARSNRPDHVLPVEKKNTDADGSWSNPARITTKESAPAFTVTSDRVVGGKRMITFNVKSTRNALNLWYTMKTNGKLETLSVDGKKVPLSQTPPGASSGRDSRQWLQRGRLA